MPPEITETELRALLAHTGIPLTTAQIVAIHAVYGGMEAWRRSIRTPVPEPAAEPATTFSTEPGR